jgi:hypothetical protein
MNTLIYSPEKNKVANQERIRQLFEESESWKRLLDFICEENNYLKIRLRHIDNLRISEQVPGKKENMQLEIQKTDQVISLNKSAIISYEKWLTRQQAQTPDEIESVFKRHIGVRKQIERAEINFAIQKVTFNDQLTKYL